MNFITEVDACQEGEHYEVDACQEGEHYEVDRRQISTRDVI